MGGAGMLLRVLLTFVLVGVPTGAAMYRVLDRSESGSTSENGALVEPVFESPTPEPVETEEPDTPPPPRRTAAATHTPQRTAVVITHSPRPTRTEDPHEEEDEETDHPEETGH